jgi:beta-phosphoglucomutase
MTDAPRAVIFDMDGVLIDSYAAHLAAWQRLGRRVGREVTEEQFVLTFGRRNPEIMHTLWGDAVPPEQVDDLARWKEAEYRDILREAFPAMPGARALVRALRAAGFRVAIGSSGPPENVDVAVRGLGCEGAFDATVDGYQVTRGKPHPEVFLKAAEKVGVPPARCAVVEDAVPGVQAAVAGGMTAVAITGTAPRERLIEAGAALVVDSLEELSPARFAALIDARG